MDPAGDQMELAFEFAGTATHTASAVHPVDLIELTFEPSSLVVLNIILGFIMFGVALDIKPRDFTRIARDPRGPLVGLVTQFFLLPAITFVLTLIIKPPPSVALGMLLVASCPGGNISNFMAYLARGNAALSVAMTAISTCAAIFMTPFNITFWGSLQPGTRAILTQVAVDPVDMLTMVAMLLGIPLILGMAVGSRFPGFTAKVRGPLRIGGGVIFLAIVIIMLVRNGHAFSQGVGVILVLAVILHNATALTLGYSAGRLFRCPRYDSRAIAIEVGIQNSALGLVLIFNFFGGMGGMAVVAAGWGVWHIISGLSLATFWSRRPVPIPGRDAAET